MNHMDRQFLNALEGCTFPDVFGFKDDDPSPTQHEIVDRLIRYYHVQKAAFSAAGMSTNEDMWRTIVANHRKYESALEACDVSQVSDMLLNVCRGPLVMGFMNFKHYTELLDFRGLGGEV